MSAPYASLGGKTLTALRVHVPPVGPWHAEADLDSDAELGEGRIVLRIAALELTGTVVQGGTFAAQRRVRVVGGAGGWAKSVAAKAYHNDAGVKARTVAEDAARAVGEQLGTFIPARERLGADYVRARQAASVALEDTLGGVAWWVDYAGVTNAGPRPGELLDPTAYEVLAFDPRDRVATLAVDDPGAVRLGAMISERLDAPLTIRELEIELQGGELRIHVWGGEVESARGRITGLLRSIARRSVEDRLYGAWRYRVTRMAAGGDRVELQAVRKDAGLPDVLPVSIWPGVPGAYVDLTPGAEVLVEFIEGQRTMPVVTAFAGPDGAGFVPVGLTLGGKVGSPAARQGDTVDILLPPSVFSGVIGGSPASGVLAFGTSKTLGIITGGSSKVSVAP